MSDPLAQIERLLADTLGVDPHSLGQDAVAIAVRARQERLELADATAYLERLRLCADERQELIEALVVPETWFFRDYEPFVLLAQVVRKHWRPATPDDALRVLSVPCATGEEPYSIAITLIDAGLQPGQYQIDAVDVNRESLREAQAGVYGAKSFRGHYLLARQRFFEPRGNDHYMLGPRARDGVRFIHANILSPSFPPDAAPYDIIFCRNLLIYMHGAAREQIIQTLDRWLRPCGFLFVGHAEMISALVRRFPPVNHPGAFACRKPPAIEPAMPPFGRRSIDFPPPCDPKADRIPATLAPPAPPAPSFASMPLPPCNSDLLNRAEQMADIGRLAEAAALCERFIEQNRSSARAYFLLGLIRDAAGDADAAEQGLTRALYLDAAHADALEHLALIRERRGDRDAADLLRQRAARARSRGP